MIQKRVICLALIIIFSLSWTVTAAPYGYEVTLGDIDTTGMTPLEPEKLTFWQLSPDHMAYYIVFVFCPEFVILLDLLLYFRLASVLIFKQITEEGVLKSRPRTQIYTEIKENPCIGIRHLMKSTGISKGSLRYHLGVLEYAHKISRVTDAGQIGYCARDLSDALDQKRLLSLRNDTNKRICELLLCQPGISRTRIAERIGISGPAVTWHMQRLQDVKLVHARMDGRSVRYSPDPSASGLVRENNRKTETRISSGPVYNGE